MAAGIQNDLNTINSWVGTIAIDLEQVVQRIRNLKAFLDTQTDAQLTALGFAQADVNTMRSAFTDAAHLADIYDGLATQATAYDFRTFLKLLRGTSCW